MKCAECGKRLTQKSNYVVMPGAEQQVKDGTVVATKFVSLCFCSTAHVKNYIEARLEATS